MIKEEKIMLDDLKNTTMKKSLMIPVLVILLSQFVSAQNPQWKIYNTGNSGLPFNGSNSVIVDSDGTSIWCSPGGYLCYFDGLNWFVYSDTNSGLPANSVYRMALDTNHNLWLATLSAGAVKFDRTIWTVYNTSNSGIGANVIRDIAIDSDNVKWFGTFGLVRFDDVNWKIYRTTNSGIHFQTVQTIFLKNYERWLGSHTSGISRLIETPTDTSWTPFTSSNSGLSNNDVRKIVKDSSEIVWIGTSMGGLNTYLEETNQWGLFIPPGTASSLVIDKYNNKWIGNAGTGLFKLSNDSVLTNFTPENSPMPSYSVYSIAIDSNQNIWIATGSGLVVYNENGIVGIEDPGIIELPKQFKLYQNYPNPFNPTTKIKYDILKPGNIKLSLYDVSGKQVKILFNTFVQSGEYEFEFNAFDLPSGVYFYSLEMNEFKETRKMIYLK